LLVSNLPDLILQADESAIAESEDPITILKSNGKHLLFSFPQMLAHHSVGGCPMRVGDLLGSGTISGVEEGSQGSLLEASKGGKENIKRLGGVKRKFLEDGDSVTLRGICGNEVDGLVGFGECVGRILPALETERIAGKQTDFSRGS
jgi:fumarylacetoacetase